MSSLKSDGWLKPTLDKSGLSRQLSLAGHNKAQVNSAFEQTFSLAELISISTTVKNEMDLKKLQIILFLYSLRSDLYLLIYNKENS